MPKPKIYSSKWSRGGWTINFDGRTSISSDYFEAWHGMVRYSILEIDIFNFLVTSRTKVFVCIYYLLISEKCFTKLHILLFVAVSPEWQLCNYLNAMKHSSSNTLFTNYYKQMLIRFSIFTRLRLFSWNGVCKFVLVQLLSIPSVLWLSKC